MFERVREREHYTTRRCLIGTLHNAYMQFQKVIYRLARLVSLIKVEFKSFLDTQKGLSKVCIEGKVQGKRGRGHPPTRWLDNVKKWTGFSIDKLNVATQDRGVWKDISHVGAQSAAGGASE